MNACRLCSSVASLANSTGFSRYSVRSVAPRRADARCSCEWAFAHRKNRFFARRRPYTNTGAGGVSPPWYLYNASATAIRTYTVGGLPNKGACVCANVFRHPRRADARRSWLCVRYSLNEVRFSLRNVRITEPRRADARRSRLDARLRIASRASRTEQTSRGDAVSAGPTVAEKFAPLTAGILARRREYSAVCPVGGMVGGLWTPG
jgi:hypothetical protein